jgi:two-component system, cell cycle response regulator
LLIEDNPADVRLLRETLADVCKQCFDITAVDRLDLGVKLLAQRVFDVVLLDLSLPDSQGLATFSEIYARSPTTPVVILSGLNDERVAVEAVEGGAEDYLVKGQPNAVVVARTLQHAIARHQLQVALRSTSRQEELAGLYSRKGFWPLAAQQLVLARRGSRPAVLLLVEADAYRRGKRDDGFGFLQEHEMLARAARCLRRTFRDRDVIAHLGENLFAVLMPDATPVVLESMIDRLQRAPGETGASAASPLPLHVGAAPIDMETASLEQAFAQADGNLEQNRKRTCQQAI